LAENPKALLKKLKGPDGYEEDNFFLEEALEDAKNGKGFQEVHMDQDGTELEPVDRIARQNRDSERGYFLQPIYA
jgi:hypothetical protein